MAILARKAKSLIKNHFPYVVAAYHSSRRLIRKRDGQELWLTLLEELNRVTPDVFFVEIGAMDGISYDPLHVHVVRNGWRGLLVEPLPDLYEQLKKTYHSQEQLVFENVAVAETPGTRQIYRASPEAVETRAVPEWAKGIASFFVDKNAIGGKRITDESFAAIRPHIVSQTVKCETLGNLLRKHNITRIEVLQVDTEGYDYEVLKQLDFQQFRPRIIRMEWVNLSDTEKGLSLQLLRRYGYRTRVVGSDLVAWRRLGIWAELGHGIRRPRFLR
jgi:FkbM family methyltransferase